MKDDDMMTLFYFYIGFNSVKFWQSSHRLEVFPYTVFGSTYYDILHSSLFTSSPSSRPTILALIICNKFLHELTLIVTIDFMC